MPQTNGQTHQGQLFLIADHCKQILYIFPMYDTILFKMFVNDSTFLIVFMLDLSAKI